MLRAVAKVVAPLKSPDLGLLSANNVVHQQLRVSFYC